MKGKIIIPAAIGFAVALTLTQCKREASNNSSESKGWITVEQGASWTDSARSAFYKEDQGSQIIPYSWVAALQDSNGFFLRDQMTRFGFLPIEKDSLPVGITLAKGKNDVLYMGMACAACHTREIKVGDMAYRIDGGPAIFDMESFAKDLDQMMHTAINDAARQSRLIADIMEWNKKLGQASQSAAEISEQLKLWDLRNHTMTSRALPAHAMWGMGRIDALGMILNRVTGLDIGEAPDYLIPENIVPASQPVRIPFLWNAAKQDRTQWAGTSLNGNHDWALLRNTGEIYGVFAVVHPRKDSSMKSGYDFLSDNSANFEGLERNEDLVCKIGPPKWPWSVNEKLVSDGESLFKSNCESCHGIKPGSPRPPVTDTWLTPVLNVGTDAAYYSTLGRTARTGIFEGLMPPVANSLMVTGAMSIGSLMQVQPGIQLAAKPDSIQIGRFESRVLQGIWAAAPYLHNGSVPTLSDLLKPAAERPKEFELGNAYDTLTVGLATKQKNGNFYRFVAGAPNSGNGNHGHEYGTSLSEKEREALLEYLKTL